MQRTKKKILFQIKDSKYLNNENTNKAFLKRFLKYKKIMQIKYYYL